MRKRTPVNLMLEQMEHTTTSKYDVTFHILVPSNQSLIRYYIIMRLVWMFFYWFTISDARLLELTHRKVHCVLPLWWRVYIVSELTPNYRPKSKTFNHFISQYSSANWGIQNCTEFPLTFQTMAIPNTYTIFSCFFCIWYLEFTLSNLLENIIG